jgi:hypothetical protein
MALTDDNSGVSNMVLPVQPMGNGNGGFGFGDGNGFWFLLLFFLLCGNNGWGGGFGGGFDGGIYPWMNQSNQINGGFRDQMISTQLQGIQNSVTSGFGDTALGIAGINQNICQTGNGIVGAVNGAQNAITQQMYANQIADMQQSFAAQTATMQGFNGVQSGLADVRYTEATEACATRNASAQNTRDIIDSQTRGTQAILDKLCALELDGVKGQLAQAQRENVALQNQVNMATMHASQTAQTAQILAGQAAEIDGVYNRLKNCPVPSMPVYGNTPIFTCQNNGCGCGNNF